MTSIATIFASSLLAAQAFEMGAGDLLGEHDDDRIAADVGAVLANGVYLRLDETWGSGQVRSRQELRYQPGRPRLHDITGTRYGTG
jgi:hypothetical protein